MLDFLKGKPNANSSEVLEFEVILIGIPFQGNKDRWYHWNKEITDVETQGIADEEYADEL